MTSCSLVNVQSWTWTRLQIGGRIPASAIFNWQTGPVFFDFAMIFSVALDEAALPRKSV
ncbi:MAG: hypothetical protein ACOX1P_03935 [Thermoguttaceae bacterium]|jgi:hypothetical protein